MDILDKLFSRELNRRTGEKAIKIDSEKNAATHRRSRFLGKRALAASKKKLKKEKKISKNAQRDSKARENSLFRRINIRFPWLKMVVVLVIGFIAILDLLDYTVSKVGDPYNTIKIAPMSKHVRTTERTLAGKKLVALTFDDGPSSETTPRLLDVLAKKDVPATFFMLGSMARNNPDIVKRVEREGHEVASHTMYHQNLPRISSSAATADITEAKDVFRGILGHDVNYTRPPYGNINNAVREATGTPLILWSVDTLDWKNRETGAILNTAKQEVFDGAIILMHDIYTTSVDAVEPLIDELRREGYEFASIDEIIKLRNITLEKGAAYRGFNL